MDDFNPIELLDCTLRDGSYAIDFQFTASDTESVCFALDRAGVKWIEIGHGFGMNASSDRYGVAAATDAQYLRAAADACNKARFGMFFIPGIGTQDHLRMAADHGMGFVRIGTNPSRIEDAKDFIILAKSLGLTVAFNAMKSYATPATELAQRLRQAVQWGADVVYVVDSAGCMLPSDTTAYIKRALDACNAPVGFHGHNNLHLAVANSLAAVSAGARFVDSTLQGIGRSGGNAQTEVLLVVLEKLGHRLGVDFMSIFEIGDAVIAHRVPKCSGMSSLDLTIGRFHFHSSYLPLVLSVSHECQLDPRVLIEKLSSVNTENPDIDLVRLIARDIIDSQ